MPQLPDNPIPGQPIRADWGKRLLQYLRSLRPGSSDSVRINWTLNGWTAHAKGVAGARPPKLWHLTEDDILEKLDPFTLAASLLENVLADFTDAIAEGDFEGIIDQMFTGITRQSGSAGSIAESIEDLFTGPTTIIQGVITEIDNVLNNTAPISTALSEYFQDLRKRPRDGDYLYTTSSGLVYTFWDQKVSEESGETIPSANLIFRVAFEIQLEGEMEGTNHVAMTTFPAPNIGRLILVIFDMMIGLLATVMGAGISALATAVVQGLSGALQTLYDELNALIDQFLDLLNDIPIFDPSGLQGQLDNLASDLADAVSRLSTAENALTALDAALDALQAVIDGSTTVTVVGADGSAQTIKVQEVTAGADLSREITWIDSSTGYGKRANVLMASGQGEPTANTVDVDWRAVDYVHPVTGVTYRMHCLVRVANSESSFPGYLGTEPFDSPNPNYTLTDVILCENGSTVTKKVLLQEFGGS